MSFPFQTNHPTIKYFDTAATCQLPESVIAAQHAYWEHAHANAHRGSHQLASAATDVWEGCRQQVATHLQVEMENISLQTSSTQALNLLALGLEGTVSAGQNVVVSAAEHHANWLPWQRLCQRRGAEFRVIPVAADTGELRNPTAYIDSNTALVAVSAASNVSGVVFDLAPLLSRASAAGAVTIVDGAQLAAHLDNGIATENVDAWVFSGHKCYGPTGIAGLYLSARMQRRLVPVILGGGMVESVTTDSFQAVSDIRRFEAGTPNVVAAAGLTAALQWLAKQPKQQQRLHGFRQQLYDAINNIAGSHILAPTAQHTLPLLSATFAGVHPQELAWALDQQGFAVRAGSHCAQPLMQHWQLSGCIRIAPGLHNSADEVSALAAALSVVVDILRG
ncbi:hypothetical protein CWI84_10480 [Idiomarina tyrosinivorans]|uniref:Aminotransferase class V domain-containing protein n=1 Tax=Idiomarina tyrosinivorans TaxID=1445662 RepID=A0A432ZL80_9GAMM|nr:aminotransferase class V-fold PLP-dependent enzyme [Idiomarina tyrosinivorans]RUO78757.1 hypothetical protein CWI84_10480 [Idiomarina tyrosinivorans]